MLWNKQKEYIHWDEYMNKINTLEGMSFVMRCRSMFLPKQ